jgi:hypothetical protein
MAILEKATPILATAEAFQAVVLAKATEAAQVVDHNG